MDLRSICKNQIVGCGIKMEWRSVLIRVAKSWEISSTFRKLSGIFGNFPGFFKCSRIFGNVPGFWKRTGIFEMFRDF